MSFRLFWRFFERELHALLAQLAHDAQGLLDAAGAGLDGYVRALDPKVLLKDLQLGQHAFNSAFVQHDKLLEPERKREEVRRPGRQVPLCLCAPKRARSLRILRRKLALAGQRPWGVSSFAEWSLKFLGSITMLLHRQCAGDFCFMGKRQAQTLLENNL